MGDSKLIHILQAQTQINHSGLVGGGRGKKEKEASDSFPENVWENIMRWIAFVEECIFILPPPSLSASELEDTPKRKKKEARKELKSSGKETTENNNNSQTKSNELDNIEYDASQVSELFLLRVHSSNFGGGGLGTEFPFPEDDLTKDECVSPRSHRDEEKSKWKDFHFAQRLLDLVDILLFDNAAKVTTHPSSRVKELEQGIIRHSLRLILYTLHETDAVLNTKRILHRQEQLGKVLYSFLFIFQLFFTSLLFPVVFPSFYPFPFSHFLSHLTKYNTTGNVKEMVETYCASPSTKPLLGKKGKKHSRTLSSGYNMPEFLDETEEDERENEEGEGDEEENTIMSSRLSAALGIYVEGKVKQWEQEAKEVTKTITNSINRLRRLIRILLSLDGGTDCNVQRVLYIVSFLFKAMKLSHSFGGMATEALWKLFKDIVGYLQDLNEIRIQLPAEMEKSLKTSSSKNENSGKEKGGEEKAIIDEEEQERKKEYVSQYLMKLFSFPPNPNSITDMIPSVLDSTPPPSSPSALPRAPIPSFLSSDALLIRRFEEAITDTLSAELRYGVTVSNRLQENKHLVKAAIGKQIKDEFEAFEGFSAMVHNFLFVLKYS